MKEGCEFVLRDFPGFVKARLRWVDDCFIWLCLVCDGGLLGGVAMDHRCGVRVCRLGCGGGFVFVGHCGASDGVVDGAADRRSAGRCFDFGF